MHRSHLQQRSNFQRCGTGRGECGYKAVAECVRDFRAARRFASWIHTACSLCPSWAYASLSFASSPQSRRLLWSTSRNGEEVLASVVNAPPHRPHPPRLFPCSDALDQYTSTTFAVDRTNTSAFWLNTTAIEVCVGRI